ncbi:MAG: proprotein convertase P-domain-containing protein, partial [Bacteroidota bacterium]
MKESIIQKVLSLFCLITVPGLISAQAFSGNINDLIPGNTQGYYCGNAAISSANINLSGRIGENYIIDSVVVNIIHEFPAEMQLSLISPHGNILNLSIGNGGSLDNAFSATVFADGGGEIINSAPPFAGFYEPQGGLLNEQFDGEKVAGDWQLEICDGANNANGGIINEFTIYLTEILAPLPEPTYSVALSSTQFVNVNLNEDCMQLLRPAMVLNGNFDLDGDGEIPPNNAFEIIVNDDNPCNGPIIDGCGDFEYWVSAADTIPQPERGFRDCADGDNILSFTTVPNPGSGQSAEVDITFDTITLLANGGNVATSPVIAGISYVFPRAGTAGFRVSFDSDEDINGGSAIDIVRVSFDGTETPILMNINLSDVYTFAQPIEIAPGDRLQIELRETDGQNVVDNNPAVAK